jgi:hypothetical protein
MIPGNIYSFKCVNMACQIFILIGEVQYLVSKNKTLCDWDRTDIEKNMVDILKIINSPRYICRKCARVARIEDMLCKPVKIKKVRNN